MKRISQKFGFCLSLAIVSQAGASTFDQCVLERMRAVTSDKAAIAIKESCLRAAEVPLPPEAVNALSTGSLASYEQAPALEGGAGLYIVVNNQSAYVLTELTIEVSEKKNPTVQDRYKADRFWPVPHPHNSLVGPYPDPIDNETIRSGMREIFVRIGKWDQSSVWSIVAAKGFLAASNQDNSARPAAVQSKPIGDENVHDACKAYADVLSRMYVNPIADIEIEEAKESSLCAGYIAGFLGSAEFIHYNLDSHTATYASRGYKWCWPTLDRDDKRGHEVLLEVASRFTKFLEEQDAPYVETFVWATPSFPAAMQKYYPCKEAP
jgi:hypothetical protein